MAKLITETFRTAPTEATLLLSGLLPIDYTILEYEGSAFCPSAKTLLKKWLKTHHIIIYERPAIMENVKKFHLPKNPPW